MEIRWHQRSAGTGAGGIVNESWNDKTLSSRAAWRRNGAFRGAEDGGVTVGTDGRGLCLSIDFADANKLSQHTTPRGGVFHALAAALNEVVSHDRDECGCIAHERVGRVNKIGAFLAVLIMFGVDLVCAGLYW